MKVKQTEVSFNYVCTEGTQHRDIYVESIH